MMDGIILTYLFSAAASVRENAMNLLCQNGLPEASGGHGWQGAGGAARRAGPVRDRKLRPLLAAAGLVLPRPRR